MLTSYPVNEEFERQLSGPFYFRQKEHGPVVEVLFPKATESPQIAGFKKGKDKHCFSSRLGLKQIESETFHSETGFKHFH